MFCFHYITFLTSIFPFLSQNTVNMRKITDKTKAWRLKTRLTKLLICSLDKPFLIQNLVIVYGALLDLCCSIFDGAWFFFISRFSLFLVYLYLLLTMIKRALKTILHKTITFTCLLCFKVCYKNKKFAPNSSTHEGH